MPPKKIPAKLFETPGQNYSAWPAVMRDQAVQNFGADRFEVMFDYSIAPKTFILLSGEITAT